MRTALISMLFFVGMMFVHTQTFAAGGSGPSATANDQDAVIAQGVTLSGHVIPAVKALPEKRFAPDSILIRFRSGTSADDKAVGRQKVKGKKLRAYTLVPGLEHLRIGIPGLEVEEAISILERLPFVKYAQPNYVITINETIPDDPLFSEQWALYNTGQASAFTDIWTGELCFQKGTEDADIDAADIDAVEIDPDAKNAWDIITSSSHPVAIIDTGIGYNHPDLVDNMWVNTLEFDGDEGVDDDLNGYVDDIHGYNFVSNGSTPPLDGHGHGTHVAGIVAAQGNNGISIRDFGGFSGLHAGSCGVLWDGKLMALKAIGDDGTGWLTDAIAALEYAKKNGARISNSSWGYYDTGEPDHNALYEAILLAQEDNHLFIAAAGNGNNYGSPGWDTDVTAHYPSGFDLDNIISVAATDNKDNLAFFSNYGLESVDLAAPGVGIFSTHMYNLLGLLLDDYAWFSGTSMATPHVTGVVAMVTEQHSDWTYSQIRDHIFATVRVPEVGGINPLAGKTVTGGIVNAANAVAGGSSPPMADFTYSANELTVTFTDQSTDEGTIGYWDWDFGDGIGTSSDQNPVYPYDDYGTYNVTLTVTDDDGISDSISKVVDLTAPSECGDETCAEGEDCDSCPEDCFSGEGIPGVCGNGTCEPDAGEDCFSCPNDCAGVQTGKPSNRFCCGATTDCVDSRCDDGELYFCDDSTVASCCGDLICEGIEDDTSCGIDCGSPVCMPRGQACTNDSECCSGDCHDRKLTCK